MVPNVSLFERKLLKNCELSVNKMCQFCVLCQFCVSFVSVFLRCRGPKKHGFMRVFGLSFSKFMYIQTHFMYIQMPKKGRLCTYKCHFMYIQNRFMYIQNPFMYIQKSKNLPKICMYKIAKKMYIQKFLRICMYINFCTYKIFHRFVCTKISQKTISFYTVFPPHSKSL